MHHFARRDGVLHAEAVDLERLAALVGTPFYCYSAATLRRHVGVFRAAFGDLDPLVAYSVKANSNLAVLSLMREEGAGADVVSGGELRRALEAGVPAGKIVFSGVGKTREEMAAALDAGIFQFNVESENELSALGEVARAKGAIAPVAFRINPDVSAGGHAKISTGKAEDKFGVPWTRAREIYARAAETDGVRIQGVDVHIGSQIAALDPFERAFNGVAELVRTLRADGHEIETLDLGGGLGIPYGEPENAAGDPPHPDDYAGLIRRIAAPLGVRLIFEPGRLIVGNAGVLVSRVLYVKEGEAKKFLIVDAAMNDLIRPALYDAYHAVAPVRDCGGAPQPYDIVGPICETSDSFARARDLPPVNEGDLVAFMSAGAYGAVQASQYNTRPLIPEVLADKDRFAIIRRRPSIDEMLDCERNPVWSKA